MTAQNLPHESQVLREESFSRRTLPVNLDQKDMKLFSHELERVIPATTLVELHNIKISPEGILFKANKILPESFAFPTNIEHWKRRSFLKFFATNNFIRRSRRIEHDVFWVTDDWSGGYFHWLTDVLTRLLVVRTLLDDKLLLLPRSYESLDFVRASLVAFDVKPEFMSKNEVVKCRRLLMPTHTAPSGHYNEGIIRGVRDVLLEAYGDDSAVMRNDRIYISRGRAPKRRISNEAAILTVLEEFGFQTIYAEDISFAQQVEIFSRARYVVSNHGAGLTNIMFMPADSRVLELRHHKDCVNNCYFTLASALNMNYLYQTCQSINVDEDPHSVDLVVDTETLKENLKLLTQSST